MPTVQFLGELPLPNDLNKMDSSQLTALSEKLTGLKEEFMQQYKLQQETLHTFIKRKQDEEQKQRRANDPEYDSKMQTVHYGKAKLKVPPQEKK